MVPCPACCTCVGWYLRERAARAEALRPRAGSAVQIWQGAEAGGGARGAALASAHELLPALGLPPSTPVCLVKQARARVAHGPQCPPEWTDSRQPPRAVTSINVRQLGVCLQRCQLEALSAARLAGRAPVAWHGRAPCLSSAISRIVTFTVLFPVLNWGRSSSEMGLCDALQFFCPPAQALEPVLFCPHSPAEPSKLCCPGAWLLC